MLNIIDTLKGYQYPYIAKPNEKLNKWTKWENINSVKSIFDCKIIRHVKERILQYGLLDGKQVIYLKRGNNIICRSPYSSKIVGAGTTKEKAKQAYYELLMSIE